MDIVINYQACVAVLLYSTLGCLVFGIAFKVMDFLVPGNFWQEIMEEHNQALAIIVGALGIGISIIIAAAIKG